MVSGRTSAYPTVVIVTIAQGRTPQRWRVMLRRRLTRFPRTVLLLLLVPLLGAVIWQAIRFTPMYVVDLAFSAVARFPDRHADRVGPICFASCPVTCCVWCLLAAFLYSNLYSKNAFDWWPEMVCGFAALAVLLSFSIFRLHGYHVSGRHLRVEG